MAAHKTQPEQPTSAQQAFISLLFNADHPSFSGNYGDPCEDAFLEAFASADESQDCTATVRRGDILVRNLARTIRRVVVPPVDPKARSWTANSNSTGTDRRRLATVVGDLTDSLSHLWHTANITELPGRMIGSNVYCLSIFPVSIALAERVDSKLQAFRPYLGALQIDPGNPVHIEVFSRLLPCVFFHKGTMYASRWDTDEGVYTFGRIAARYFAVDELSFWDFKKAAPPVPDTPQSLRGQQTARMLAAVTKPSPFELVADALLGQSLRNKIRTPIDFTLLSPQEEQLEIPVGKLLKYALNTDHPKGKHKAKLFSDLLCIHSEHWRFLAYQLAAALPNADLENVRVTEHGIQFSALLQVVGLNDQICTIETGWIIRSSGPAQLATSYPTVKKKQRDASAVRPPWVPNEVPSSQRWKKLYEVARSCASAAADAYFPTPVQYSGFAMELEGDCGGAMVRLDGRSSFARWLVTNGHASPSDGQGVTLYADIGMQSADRAECFSKVFARILWLNGIDGALVEKYLA